MNPNYIPMKTLSDISAIRADVVRLRLAGHRRVGTLADADLADAYNGTGPEFLPDAIRARLDAVTRPFRPAVMVHDVDFTLSDGTVGSFRAANRRLLVNCIICACDAHPWYSWRRYALILESVVIYRACAKFGWIAWIQAYSKNTKQER